MNDRRIHEITAKPHEDEVGVISVIVARPRFAIHLLDTFRQRSVTIETSMQFVTEPAISDKLRRRFLNASRVLVLTGAGVSAESGVPTFRGGGNSAVWKGMPFDVISSAGMVERDLPAVWEWFDYRRDPCKR